MDTLRYGARGGDVWLLQLALQRAGYGKDLVLDGIFGNDTQRALLRFQRENGLAADGVVGAQSWTQLRPWLLGYRQVTLRRGDSFYRLALRYGSTLRAIEAANPALDPMNLQIGQTVTVPIVGELVPTDVPVTSRLVGLCLQGLTARYPFLALETPGYSVLGRPLYFVRLGQSGQEIFLNAAHHANEWITTTLLLKFLEEAARALAFDESFFGQSASALFSHVRVWFAPLVNPDGAGFVFCIEFDARGKKYGARTTCTGAEEENFVTDGWRSRRRP